MRGYLLEEEKKEEGSDSFSRTSEKYMTEISKTYITNVRDLKKKLIPHSYRNYLSLPLFAIKKDDDANPLNHTHKR